MSTRTATGLPTGTWTTDPVHSSATFSVRRMGAATFRAGFGQIAASYDGSTGQLTGEVPVESVDVTQPDLRAHLLAGFFDAANHPTITFASTAINDGSDGTFVIDGDLTIKGVSRSVRATGRASEPGADGHGGQLFGLDLELTLDRRDYAIDFNAELPGGRLAVDWDVRLEVSLALGQAAPSAD